MHLHLQSLYISTLFSINVLRVISIAQFNFSVMLQLSTFSSINSEHVSYFLNNKNNFMPVPYRSFCHFWYHFPIVIHINRFRFITMFYCLFQLESHFFDSQRCILKSLAQYLHLQHCRVSNKCRSMFHVFFFIYI